MATFSHPCLRIPVGRSRRVAGIRPATVSAGADEAAAAARVRGDGEFVLNCLLLPCSDEESGTAGAGHALLGVTLGGHYLGDARDRLRRAAAAYPGRAMGDSKALDRR